MRGPAFDGSQVGPPIGYFTYSVADDHWSWSEGIYTLHGYALEEVPATTETLLRHKHPDDMARAYDVLEKAVGDGRPFSCYHRVIDRRGQVRSVLSVGRGITDSDGKVEELVGFFVDLSDARRAETEAEVEAALAGIAKNRAVIEQAKGVIMFAAGCDADAAFGLLRRSSSTSNLKVSDIARELTAWAATELRADGGLAAVSDFLGSLAPAESPMSVAD
jgi:PAS domain S-box-containing protein